MKRVGAILIGALMLFSTACHAAEPSPSVKEDGVTVSTTPIPDDVLSVTPLCQYPSLPTGCEATAAAMVLQYHGENVLPETFAQDWLVCDDTFYERRGTRYGPDPREVFVGDPFSEEGYGCYAPPIAAAVNRKSALCTAQTVRGKCLSYLHTTYVQNGLPVLVWVTMEMREPQDGSQWTLASGEAFTWVAGEHCMVLIGADRNNYYFNDPRTGSTVRYEKALCEERFAQLGSQAVVITD